jgi:hypothetical protein
MEDVAVVACVDELEVVDSWSFLVLMEMFLVVVELLVAVEVEEV